MRSDRNVADAVEEGEEQGKPDQRNDVGDGRREHQAAESLLVVRQPAEESGVRRARREISRVLLQRFAQNRRGSVRRPVALSKNLMSFSLMANSYTPSGRNRSGRNPTVQSSPRSRFIGGEPRKPATKVSAGLSYTSWGDPTCRTFPPHITTIRSPRPIASIWSWVT